MAAITKTWTVPITKTDPAKQQVFGWASVIEQNGVPVEDSQGDVIDAAELEKAAYQFALQKGVAGDNHDRIGVGRLIESLVFTKEKQEALGIDLKKVGWFIGFQIDDAAVWKGIVDGELSAFSIGGTGQRETIAT
jgi:putative serine protease XkdF